MEKAWFVYWVLAGIFALADSGLFVWSLLQPSGQAMPATILPMIATVIGVVFFSIVAVIISVVEAFRG
jgi:MFS superfamily sulfate permease-like transporter